MQIAHHMSELWKKQKGVLFMKHRVYFVYSHSCARLYYVHVHKCGTCRRVV